MEPQTSTDLRAEVRAAANAAMALTAASRSGIRAVIAAVKQAITDARLAAARTGDPIEEAAPAEKAALAELLEERDTLAERHHAAHENAALLAIRAESALISEVSTQTTQDLQRRLAAIAHLHQEAGLEDPTKTKVVRNTYRGILREIGSFQEGKAPLLPPPCVASFQSSSESAGRRRRGTGRYCSSASPGATG
ncbi:MAG TPA: hypothetical protein VGV91_18005 [Rubrobacter sp.]|nr:hypothetical protein [Rubrobacter sp.]